MAAMIGAETLVPPSTYQLPLSATATPVFGSATADTSAWVRKVPQAPVGCHDGFVSYAEQPPPVPPRSFPQADSVQPAAMLPARLVPPTAVTSGAAAGAATR